MLQRWFHDRYRAVQTMSYQLTDATHLVLIKRVEKCCFMIVNPIDWNIFSVKRSGKHWTVDLARKICTCNKFQMDHFPCSHALAAARERNLDLITLCSDYYNRQTFINTYSVSQSCRRCGQPWHNSIRCSNPPMINEGPSRGVPDEYRRKCSICHSIGHNKQTCPNIDSNRE
ncbi:hypothetical protein Ddye_005666 [Dipteronia dyeriana]|uniref:SWIM-type domain-containing protein n=1 Tax=Dipteronia dyeriana TaxID=168575 RepID=A0AAD9XGW7_9ROSI|nr:hypothetical protein Ddye_005666 [Dipteronia dyeriana]